MTMTFHHPATTLTFSQPAPDDEATSDWRPLPDNPGRLAYQAPGVQVYAGDCLDVLRTFGDASIDAIATDPPYELGFMGKHWDGTGIAYSVELWTECLRVLKPGGHLLSFGGSRTWHRMACAIEDAGFELRDSIAWLYGSGFPKSLDVSKAIDKAAGATREVVSEGAPVKRMIPGADQNRTGSWIKDNGREYVPQSTAPATEDAARWEGWGTALKPAHEPVVWAVKPLGIMAEWATIGSQLDEMESLWQAPEVEPTTPTGAAADSSDQTATSQSESETTTSLSIVSSWRECWAETYSLLSTSTTSTTSSMTTDLRTLSSCLSQITQESTQTSPTRQLTSSSSATAAANLFAAINLIRRVRRTDGVHPSARRGQRRCEPVLLRRQGAHEGTPQGRRSRPPHREATRAHAVAPAPRHPARRTRTRPVRRVRDHSRGRAP